MTDIKTKKQRSYNMSKIKSKGTKPELLVRKYLSSNGIRYRCHVKNLPGSPDIAIKKYKTVIQVNGCFWHVHNNCSDFKFPQSNKDFWSKKFSENLLRDEINDKKLDEKGFRIFKVWECEIKKHDYKKVSQAIEYIKSQTIS